MIGENEILIWNLLTIAFSVGWDDLLKSLNTQSLIIH